MRAKISLSVRDAVGTDEASAYIEYKDPDSVYSDDVTGWGKNRRAALRNLRAALNRMLKVVQSELDRTKGAK